MGNVLVIEDDIDSADVLKRLLNRRGHHADIAYGGGQALEWLDANPPPPDVVVLDWAMPEMDGGELLQLLRAHPAYHSVKIMIFSTLFDHARTQEAMRLGADEYLVKGAVAWDAVLDTVETLMEQTAA